MLFGRIGGYRRGPRYAAAGAAFQPPGKEALLFEKRRKNLGALARALNQA
jgi:hypothetical protein